MEATMYVDILILALLLTRPRHGYEIKRQVQGIIGDIISINNNQLYPALRRFEEAGAITREVVHTPGKPDKHVYQLTDRGEEILQDLLRDFTPEQARDDVEFQVHVGYFHLLEPEARLAILATREGVLHKWQAHLERSLTLARARPEYQHYAQQIIIFNLQRIQHELDWIAQLREEANA
jgi:DNA-binding PadR family transcriptional regulator